jgi:putative Mg2+ transporter-C (MgtC) family protein
MDTLDVALRLGVATLVGVLLGLNRDLHGKSTGVRTLGLVCLGSAWPFCRSTRRPAPRRAA